MAFIRESELLFGDGSLLSVYGPLISDVCASPARYKDPVLRSAAVLALSKLMCVSSQFCESQLPLLFRISETATDPAIRSNIVIALGDIAVSFSNMIDENRYGGARYTLRRSGTLADASACPSSAFSSDRLYQGLDDPDLHVKKNTLMVLTHLILNGMIKVKGQLGEMAKCIEDPDQRISDLARLFFKELSTKENALYNNLQDVISHLSIGAHAVDEETFEKTMRYIFTFIEKVRRAVARPAVPRLRDCRTDPFAPLPPAHRRSRPSRSSRSSASASVSRLRSASGATLRSACRCCRTSRSGR